MKGLRLRRVAAVVAVLAALMAMVAATQAVGRAIFKVEYRGWTTQTFAHKPKPTIFHAVVRVDVDRTNNRIEFYGIKIICSLKSSYIVTSSYKAKINAKGNFTYRLSSTHLGSISGHVTKKKITGTFTGSRARGCNVRGTYSAVPAAKWPPAPKP